MSSSKGHEILAFRRWLQLRHDHVCKIIPGRGGPFWWDVDHCWLTCRRIKPRIAKSSLLLCSTLFYPCSQGGPEFRAFMSVFFCPVSKVPSFSQPEAMRDRALTYSFIPLMYVSVVSTLSVHHVHDLSDRGQKAALGPYRPAWAIMLMLGIEPKSWERAVTALKR